jgi:hypothetical protein
VRTRRTALILTTLALLVGLGVSQVMRDVTPPELYLELAQRVPSGVPLELFVSASEPVRYTLRYGAVTLEEVGQDLRASLLAAEGEVVLSIRAEDGAGNVATLERTVVGLAPPELRLATPATVLPGAPLAVRIAWRERGAAVATRSLRADGAELALFGDDGTAFALVAVPLGTEPGSVVLEARLDDEYGRTVTATSAVSVLPDPQPVELLSLSPAVLAVSTPEGRELERLVLEAAFAAATPEPLWSAPFVLPIDGRGTSGFGSPRRYAPGGRVSYHFGTDLAAPTGTPVAASNAGVVSVADFFPIKGGLVIVDHGGGVASLYFHQSRLLVAAGERVERGQVIGEVGTTGLSSGPHLHWEVRIAGVPTDPLAWVDRQVPFGFEAAEAGGGDAP